MSGSQLRDVRLPAAPQRIPARIWLTDTTLAWEWGAPDDQPVRANETQLLKDFIDLSNPRKAADHLPDRTVSFAKRYGVLELCEHGMLAYHWGGGGKLRQRLLELLGHPDDEELSIGDLRHLLGLVPRNPHGPQLQEMRTWAAVEGETRELRLVEELSEQMWERICPPVGREPLKTWSAWSRRVRSVWQCARALRGGRKTDPADGYEPWGVIGLRRDDVARLPMDRLSVLLGTLLTKWYSESGAVPEIHWRDATGGPMLRLGGSSLIAAVTRQLTAEIARLDGFQACAGCGILFTPLRHPRENQKSWCADCRAAKRPQAAAARAFRARNR